MFDSVAGFGQTGDQLLEHLFLMPDAGYRWALLIGVVPLVTGLMGSCPAYSLLGINTCSLKK